MGILDMLQTGPSGGKGGGIVERAREIYNPNRYDGVQLGMIGGVKPGGGYWQGLDGNGLAHASDPSYEDYSQRFREFSFAEKPGWVPVGQRDGRTVYAAPDYVKTDGVYDMFSAGEAAKYAGTHGLLLPTRDEVKSFYDQATHIPMPTQNIGAMGGPGDAAAYTAAIGDVQGPVVHGKEWYVAGDQNASAAPSQPPIRNYANAIAAVESRGSGDYLAVGPKTRTGARAYGRYQVMDFNVGPWTEKYYGKRLTPQEFLANPQAQDAVFNGEFGSYVEKYGNPQDAASVWFTGKPLAQGGGRSDGYITGNEYVDRFTRFLGDGTTVMASNNPGQQIADDTMRALGMDPIQQQPQPRGVMDFLKGTETGGERSYLGGWLTPDRRDNLIMALQGMTLNPNAAMINAASDRISAREGRKADQQKTSRTLAVLQQMGASPEVLAMAQIDPALALRTQANASQAQADPRVQSTQILPDGSVISVFTDGTRSVKSPTGETLTGQAAADAIKQAQQFGASIQGDRAFARGTGANEADMATGEQAGAATSLGGKRGEMVTSAFEQADVAMSSINNIREAIKAIENGAESGIVYNMLPNVTEASASLKNALDKMGLDVIGSVTFGALSAAELKLAMETAAPRNLAPPQLREWLDKKLRAQEKLRVALLEQAQFLSNPENTLQDWANKVGGGQSTGQPAPQNDTDPLGIR